MTNAEILMNLQSAENNAEAVSKYLSQWNKDEQFPLNTVDEARRYIKMHVWKYEDFDFEMERITKDNLPNFMLDVFFELKEFRSHPKNEVSSSVEVLSRMLGYPLETQNDKAFALYAYVFNKYFNNSRLNPNEGEHDD